MRKKNTPEAPAAASGNNIAAETLVQGAAISAPVAPHTTGNGGRFVIGRDAVTRVENTKNHPDGNRARPNLTTQGDK